MIATSRRYSRPSPSVTPGPRWNGLLLIACIVAAAGASLWLKQDANWDLQNYHFYNPWAWWHGRIFGQDIAAAQLQTFHNPLLDLPFYAMVAAAWPPEAIAVVLAIPTGIAAFFLAKLLPLLFADLPLTERRVAVVAAFAIGVTAAMGIGVLGTTMNEWPLPALVMPALFLLVRALVRSDGAGIPRGILLVAGLLVGIAVGGKLTAGTFAVGLCAALLLRGLFRGYAWRRRFIEAFLFGIGVVIGTAITYGFWGAALASHFDNPIFPYGNGFFKSDWWSHYPILSRIYGPHTLGHWLGFPFDLMGPGVGFVTEVPYRDPRFPVTWALALIAAAAWLSHRLSGKPAPHVEPGVSAAWQVVGIFVIVSFLLWTAQHSIYRYLVTLDLLTGALIVTLLQRLLRPGYLGGIAVVATVAIIALTKPADWWRIDFGDAWFEVTAPAVEQNAMVLITTDAPVSFVFPFLPADARFIGTANTINSPERVTKLASTVNAAISAHDGPYYQLTFPAGAGASAVVAHGLRRIQSSCREIRTKMRTDAIELCRLERIAG